MIYASKSSRMSSRVIKIDDEGGDNADGGDNYDDGDNNKTDLCIYASQATWVGGGSKLMTITKITGLWFDQSFWISSYQEK